MWWLLPLGVFIGIALLAGLLIWWILWQTSDKQGHGPMDE